MGSGKQKTTRGWCADVPPGGFRRPSPLKSKTNFQGRSTERNPLNRSCRGPAQGLNGLSPGSPQGYAQLGLSVLLVRCQRGGIRGRGMRSCSGQRGARERPWGEVREQPRRCGAMRGRRARPEAPPIVRVVPGPQRKTRSPLVSVRRPSRARAALLPCCLAARRANPFVLLSPCLRLPPPAATALPGASAGRGRVHICRDQPSLRPANLATPNTRAAECELPIDGARALRQPDRRGPCAAAKGWQKPPLATTAWRRVHNCNACSK